MWIKENHRRINKSLPIITTKAITELGKIYNRLKSWILGTRYGKAVRREFCVLAAGSGAASDAASAVLPYTEQTEQHFGCLFLYLSASSYNLVQSSIPSLKNQNKQNWFMQNVEKIWGQINNSHRFLNAIIQCGFQPALTSLMEAKYYYPTSQVGKPSYKRATESSWFNPDLEL